MSYMFYECSELKTIIINNFNTNNVKNMCNMFYNCSSLIEINLSKFIINNDTNIDNMLNNCSKEIVFKIISQNENLINNTFY